MVNMNAKTNAKANIAAHMKKHQQQQFYLVMVPGLHVIHHNTEWQRFHRFGTRFVRGNACELAEVDVGQARIASN